MSYTTILTAAKRLYANPGNLLTDLQLLRSMLEEVPSPSPKSRLEDIDLIRKLAGAADQMLAKSEHVKYYIIETVVDTILTELDDHFYLLLRERFQGDFSEDDFRDSHALADLTLFWATFRKAITTSLEKLNSKPDKPDDPLDLTPEIDLTRKIQKEAQGKQREVWRQATELSARLEQAQELHRARGHGYVRSIEVVDFVEWYIRTAHKLLKSVQGEWGELLENLATHIVEIIADPSRISRNTVYA